MRLGICVNQDMEFLPQLEVIVFLLMLHQDFMGFIKGHTPGKSTGCEDGFTRLV